MKPVITYYGSKVRLAPWIVSLFPSHRCYLEPFAGSAAVLLAKPRAPHEVINDRDSNIVCFLRMLRDRGDELVDVCRLTPYARDEFHAADLEDPDVDDLERARRFWIRTTQGWGHPTAVANPTGWSVSVRRGSSSAQTAQRLVDRFAAVAARLRHVMIDNADACDVIERLDITDAVIYCDPPYLDATRTSLAKRAADYRCEFSTADDHRGLATVLRAAAGTVFLSGYPSTLYDELYDGWHRVERRVSKPSSNYRGGTGEPAVETVWSNRPITQQLPLDIEGVAS